MVSLPEKKLGWLVVLIILLTVTTFLACNDSPTKPKNPPVIISFTAVPANLSPGDSSLLSYETKGADSLMLFPGNIKLTNPAVGSRYVKPDWATDYILVAYNRYGRDSASVRVNVAVLQVLNGLYYKGEMNSDILSPLLALQVLDAESEPIQDTFIHVDIVEGDGTLSADSVQPGADDTAFVTYNFNGLLGHAVLKVAVPGVDSAEVYLRARTIIPGDLFQGQYILYQDTFGLIQAFNGAPAEVVNPEPGSGYLVLDYETAKGVVFLVGEVGAINGQVSTMDTVFMILITSPVGGTTSEGITVGSTYPELYAAYGAPQTSGSYPSYPGDTILYYDSLGLKFWCNKADTVVNQIDLIVPDTPLKKGGESLNKRNSRISVSDRRYRLILP